MKGARLATATQKKQGKKVTYYTTVENFQLFRVKPDEHINQGTGKKFVTNTAEFEQGTVRFKDGFLTVREGENVKPNPETGEPEDLVTYLESRPSFGNLFFR
jgi:mannose-6-phosphate isomerase class I